MGAGFEIRGTAISVQLSEIDGEDIEVGDPVSSGLSRTEIIVFYKPHIPNPLSASSLDFLVGAIWWTTDARWFPWNCFLTPCCTARA